MQIKLSTLTRIIKEEAEAVLNEGMPWKHTGKKNSLTKRVSEFMKDMTYDNPHWTKGPGGRPVLHSSVIDGIPVVTIKSPSMRATITLPGGKNLPIRFSDLQIYKKRGGWKRYSGLDWKEGTRKLWGHLQGRSGLTKFRSEKGHDVSGRPGRQKRKIGIDPETGRFTKAELENLMKDPKMRKAAEKEMKQLNKALSGAPKKPGVVKMILKKLPVVGRLFAIMGIVMIADDAFAAEGDPEAVKQVADDSINMLPVVGDVRGLGQLFAILTGTEPYEPKPIMAPGADASPSEKAWGGSQHTTNWKSGQY
jgi:hypothetical protein